MQDSRGVHIHSALYSVQISRSKSPCWLTNRSTGSVSRENSSNVAVYFYSSHGSLRRSEDKQYSNSVFHSFTVFWTISGTNVNWLSWIVDEVLLNFPIQLKSPRELEFTQLLIYEPPMTFSLVVAWLVLVKKCSSFTEAIYSLTGTQKILLSMLRILFLV